MNFRSVGALAVFVLIVPLSGCRTTSDGDQELMLNPLIGLIGMAVDGDDKDDYAGYFEDECCECSGKCCCD